MQLDFEIGRSTRRCAATDRALEPGDECYSMLETEGANVVRKDYCHDAWRGPSDSALGWWRSRIPEPTAKKIKLAPNDVLLQLFDELGERADAQDTRWVLALLLLRRRVLRLDVPDEFAPAPTGQGGGAGPEFMTVHCPKRDLSYIVAVVVPDNQRIDEIQKQLSDLLVAGAV